MALTFINDEGLPTTVSPDNPLPIAGGGGGDGGDGLTDEELRASPVPVSGPLTNAQYTAATGAAANAAWGGTGNGAIIPILKALYAQNEAILDALSTIADNTAPE